MSATRTQVIDQRVVEMRFDNKDFEKNVSQSMSTIEKLKNALNFDSLKAFEGIDKAANSVKLDGISNAVDNAASKFSVLEIAGVTAIAKITSAAMDAGVSLVKSLSVDQISTGFNKYAEKTTAIQTIISATGESIEKVTEQIDKLNWFTDETSYNLTDMISNIAKFTNSGVALERAVPQMMGIAAAAGDAGKGVQGATHAMEGFSKAMAQQYMSRQTWQWIQTANMDTVRLKQAMIDAAVEVGQLKKVSEGMWETLEGHEVTVNDFATNLKDKWMSAEVMERGLQVYGDFANTLSDVMDELGASVTTSEFLEMIDEYKEGTLDLADAAEKCEVSESELKEILDELSSSEYDIGAHAFKMSQEAKTFAEAIDSVKDAVSTGWMTTIEYIFGNYEQAKQLWTALANDLYTVFAESGNTRNEILSYWSEMGGRIELIHGLVEAVNLLVRPLSMVKQAFSSMFPDTEGMANVLYRLSVGFHNLMLELQPSEETMNDIYWLFRGVFTIIKSGLTLIGRLVKVIFPITKPLGSIAALILKIFGYIGKFLYILGELIMSIRILPGFTEKVRKAFSSLLDVLKKIGAGLGGAIVSGVLVLVNVFTSLVNKVVEFVQTTHPLQKALEFIKGLLQTILPIIIGVGAALAAIVAGPIVLAVAGIVKLATAIKDFIASAKPLEKVSDFLSTRFGTIGTTIKAILDDITNGFGNVKDKMSAQTDKIGDATFKAAKKVETLGEIVRATFDGVVSSIRGGNISGAFKYIGDGASLAISRIKEIIAKMKNVEKPVKTVQNTLQKTTKTIKTTTKEVKNANGQIEQATTVVKRMEDNYAGANVMIAQSGTLTRETAEEVKKSTTIWEKFVGVLKGIGTIVVGIGATIFIVIANILTKVKNLFTKITTYVKQLLTGEIKIRDIFNNLINGIVEGFKKAGEHVKEFFSFFGVDVDKVIEAFKQLGTNVSNFIHSLDEGKIAMLLFSVAMFGLAGAAIKLSGSFADVFSGIKNFFNTITSVLKKQFLKSTPLKDFAEALGLIAGALIALTYVDVKYHKNLVNVAHILGQFAIVGTALTAVMTYFAAKIGDKKLSKEFETSGKIIMGLAGAIVVLSAAMAILSKVDMVGNKSLMGAVIDWIAKIAVIFGMMLGLTTMAALFQKFAPKLTVSFISMAALGVAFYMLAKSLAEIGTIQFDNVKENLWQLGVILGAFGVVIAGIGHLKVTSFLSVLFLAKAIQTLWPYIVSIYEVLCSDKLDPIWEKADKWHKAGPAIGLILVGVGKVLEGIGKLSVLFLSIGVASVGLSAGILILVRAIKSMSDVLKTLPEEEINTVTLMIAKLMAALTISIVLISTAENIINLIGFIKSDKEKKFNTARQNFLGLAIGMVAFAGTMYLMVGALKKLYDVTKDIPTATQWKILSMFNILTLIFGLAIGAVGYAARGKHAILILGGMFALLGAMFAAMFTFYTMLGTDVGKALGAFGLLTLVVIEIGLLLKTIGKIDKDAPGKVMLSLVGIITVLGVLVGAFALLLHYDKANMDDIKNAGMIVGGIMAALLAFLYLFKLISNIPTSDSNVENSISILSKLLLAIGGIVTSIIVLDKLGSSMARVTQVAALIGLIGVVLVALTGALTWISKVDVELKRFKQTMTAFSDLVMSMVIFGSGIGLLSHACDEKEMALAAAVIAGMTTATVALTKWIMNIAKFTPDVRNVRKVMKVYWQIVGAMAAFGIELGLLAYNCDDRKLITSAAVIGVLTIATVALTNYLLYLTKKYKDLKPKDLKTTIIALSAIVIEVGLLSLAMGLLATNSDVESLGTAALIIGLLSAACLLMSDFLIFIAESSKQTSWKDLIVPIIALASVVAEVIFLGNELAKLATLDQDALRKAAITLGVFSVVMTAFSAALTYISGIIALTPAGITGLLIAAGIILGTCALLAVAGNSAEKAGEAFEKFAISMQTLQTVNFTEIASGIKAITDTSDDLNKLAGALKNLQPQIWTLRDLNNSGATTTVSESANAIKTYTQIISESGEEITTTNVKIKESYGEMVRDVESGVLSMEDQTDAVNNVVDTMVDNTEKQTGALGGFFNDLANKWKEVSNYWGSGKGANNLKQGVAEGYGDASWDQFVWDSQHPILSTLRDSVSTMFTDPTLQSVAADASDTFGNMMGNGIIDGIKNALSAGLPGIAGVIQSLFGGIISFDASKFVKISMNSNWTEDMLPGADKVNSEGTIPMRNYTDAVNGAAKAMSEAQGNSAAFAKTQMDLTANTAANGEAFKKTTDIWGGLTSSVKEGNLVTSAFAKAEDYATEKVEELGETVKDAIPGVNDLGDAMEGAGGKASKGAKGIKDFYDSLKSTLDNQLDIFSKFEIKTGVSAETMLENMKSNIDGFASWSHRMTVLAERFAEHGIDQGLYQKLAELGPKGYETMNAFYTMSEEQLDQVRELYATSLTLPEGQADIVASGFTYMGEMSVQGFSNALDDHKRAHEAAHGLGKAALEGLEEALETHSPSKKTYEIGENTDIGLKNGIVEKQWYPKLAATNMAIGIVRKIQEHLSPEKMYEISVNAINGLTLGLKDEAALAELELASEELGAIVEKFAKLGLEEESPSKALYRVGKFGGIGMANGIKDTAQNVIDAIDYVTSGAIEESSGIIDTISSYMGEDLNMVITPILDLSYLREQLNEANGLFNDHKFGVSAAGQNEGTNEGQVQNFNYTQNNYSPKALSRVEIYRQTKNQISMMKGVKANA